MDRSEAITELIKMSRQMETQLFIKPTDARREALEMGAASLKQLQEDVDKEHKDLMIECDMYGCKYEPTTKNDLGVDSIARQDIERYIEGFINEYTSEEELEFIKLELDGLKHLPSVTLQEPQSFKWCETCKEYDQEKHCCHRYSKVIRDNVEEMKQGYIKREVLNKIRAEIDKARFIDKDTRICKNALASGLEVAMQIIDKYKGESEEV